MKKLRSLLAAYKRLDANEQHRLLDYLSKASPTQLYYPASVAAKCSLGQEQVRNTFILLMSEKVLDPFTVPEFNGRLLEDFAKPGIETKVSWTVTDDNFEELHPADLKAITAYRVHPE